MGAVAKVFDEIGKAIKDAVNEIVDVVKAAFNAFVGAFKALYECTLALAQAIESGNIAAIGEKLLELGAAIATIAQPEVLAAQIGAQVAMKVVKDTIKLAAQVCGFKMQPWMQETMGMMSTASNFTSFGSAATAVGTEVMANVAGDKGPLQQQWESLNPGKPEDDNYKKLYEKNREYQKNIPDEGNDFSNPGQDSQQETSLTIGD